MAEWKFTLEVNSTEIIQHIKFNICEDLNSKFQGTISMDAYEFSELKLRYLESL